MLYAYCHGQQIILLKEFQRRGRSQPERVERMLLVVNAIASGLRHHGLSLLDLKKN